MARSLWRTNHSRSPIRFSTNPLLAHRRLPANVILFFFSVYNSLGLIFSAVVIRFIPIVIGNFVETNTSLPGQNGILPGQIGEKYIYVFLAKFTALFVLVATVTMLLAYLRHVCTMLRISW